MEINVFAEKVKCRVEEKLGGDQEISVCRMTKNNGVFYMGLQIAEDKAAVSPVICIDRHYRMYEKGETTVEGTADYVVDEYSGRRINATVDMRYFLNYENVRNGIVYRLVNTERNKELLEDIPHIAFLDLSIVFHYLVIQGQSGQASILVHNAHIKLWDVSVEQLYQAAEENTHRILEYEIKSMGDIIHEIMMQENPDEFDHDKCMDEFEDNVPMYVLSNKNRIDGAACILYPELIKNFADALDSSLYIIPSSVHELLLLPVGNDDEGGSIKNLIKEINDTQVKPEEILSYSLYYYDKGTGELTIC